MKKWRSTLACLFIFLSCCTFTVANATHIKIGVAPNGGDSVALAKMWIPFLEELEHGSDLKVRFATAPDLLEFSRRVAGGDYDLIITNRYFFTILGQKHTLTYLAELTDKAEQRSLALVTAEHIHDIEQLSGALLATKKDEDRLNLQALDDFLTLKNVTAVRDSVSSYGKILESVSEDLHLAGLVPVSELNLPKRKLNVLWKTENKTPYLLSATSTLTSSDMEKLAISLKRLLSLKRKSDKHKPTAISVLSVSPLLNGNSEASEQETH